MATTLRKYGAKYNTTFCTFAGLSTDTKPVETALLDNKSVALANGSEFIEMDTDKKYSYDAENQQWNLASSGGGGGGGSATLIEKSITENGAYNASDDSADGYSKVTVDVPNTYTAEDEGKVVDNGALVAQTAMSSEVTENGTVDTTLYNSVTVNVPSGGGGSATRKDVNFYDYDGTIVNSYTAAEFAELSELPANPTHDGLTAQGWNWSLADAKAYVADYGKLEIGQMYITSDGKTRLYITLTEGRTSPVLQLYLNANSELDIDWGDGSTHSTFISTDNGYQSERHNYANATDYVIVISVINGSFALSNNYSPNYILGNGDNSASSPNRCYSNSIKEIRFGNRFTSIGAQAFQYCASLTTITMPNLVTDISSTTFGNCYSLTAITIPSSVTSIGQQAFQNCASLATISIPSSVTSIGGSTFSNCYSLATITIPSSVTSIGQQAFQYCYSLTAITIPSLVTSIGQQAFQYCYSLATITIDKAEGSISGSPWGAITSSPTSTQIIWTGE